MNLAQQSDGLLDDLIDNFCIKPSRITCEPFVTMEFSRGNKAAVVSITPEGYIVSLATDKARKIQKASNSAYAAKMVESFLLTLAEI